MKAARQPPRGEILGQDDIVVAAERIADSGKVAAWGERVEIDDVGAGGEHLRDRGDIAEPEAVRDDRADRAAVRHRPDELIRQPCIGGQLVEQGSGRPLVGPGQVVIAELAQAHPERRVAHGGQRREIRICERHRVQRGIEIEIAEQRIVDAQDAIGAHPGDGLGARTRDRGRARDRTRTIGRDDDADHRVAAARGRGHQSVDDAPIALERDAAGVPHVGKRNRDRDRRGARERKIGDRRVQRGRIGRDLERDDPVAFRGQRVFGEAVAVVVPRKVHRLAYGVEGIGHWSAPHGERRRRPRARCLGAGYCRKGLILREAAVLVPTPA